VENELLWGGRVKSQKGERSLLMVWRLISTKDSWHVSEGGECWYLECLTSIREDYATKWRRFQKIQHSETCTDMHRLRLSTAVDGCRQQTMAVDRRSTASQQRLRTSQSVDSWRSYRQVAMPVEDQSRGDWSLLQQRKGESQSVDSWQLRVF